MRGLVAVYTMWLSAGLIALVILGAVALDHWFRRKVK